MTYIVIMVLLPLLVFFNLNESYTLVVNNNYNR